MAFNSQRQKAYLAPPCLPRTATNASQTEWVTATPPALKSRRNLKRLWSSHALWTCLAKNKLGYLSDRRAALKWRSCRGNTEYLFSTRFRWYKKHARASAQSHHRCLDFHLTCVWVYPFLESRLYPQLSSVMWTDVQRWQTSLTVKCVRP